MKRAAALALLLALGACSSTGSEDPTTGADETPDPVELTFRIWDDAAADAYAESFAAFTAENPHITVDIDVVDEGDYWDRADSDLRSGEMADVYWIDPANIADHSEDLILIDDPRPDWEKSLVDLFTVDGELRAVPQMWNSVALYYNRDLYDSSTRVDDLTWAPDGGAPDTLIKTAQQLTVDHDGSSADSDNFDPDSIRRYGFAADTDIQAAFIPFLAQAGGHFQDEDGEFAFASAEGRQSTQYLVDLIDKHHVSPPAALTHDDIQKLFTDGELVLYQADSTALTDIAAAADFSWAIAPVVGGPEGKISVVDGIAAAGSASSDHPAETRLLLEWLGTARGQDPIASHGITFPANTRAQDTYVNYWAKEGTDVSVFIESSTDAVAVSGRSSDVHEALDVIASHGQKILAGDMPVSSGLEAAQTAANDALH